MSTLTPEAKSKLAKTIRSLRERLLRDVHDRADSLYRLGVPLAKAGLPEDRRIRRQRLEDWVDEQARSNRAKGESLHEARERHRLAAEKLAAATFLNRLVVVKQMEAFGLVKPKLVTGGWDSPAYRELREFAPDFLKDESEGFGALLQLLFDELALDLPGLFGEVGISALFEIPTSTLRAVIEALDDKELEGAWTDDTTLGWVYQYWNDPEREALDAKLNAGGKVEPHEIASKTQMFTERYMVEWLLHNSLGQMWLAICRKRDWTPLVEAEGVLERLEERRKEWRAKREAGEVALDKLMSIENSLEDRWKYWVPQPMPEDAVEKAPHSIRDVKILDPACGSGHFLVIAFDLLCELYREELRHLGNGPQDDREIVESILENNLHGIDIDPRAVQIAAAALMLKAWTVCPEAHPRRLNLVASNLQLGSLPDDDPALVELREEVRRETGIPEELTDRIVRALKGADHLGSLLQVDREVRDAIQEYEEERHKLFEEGRQGDLFRGYGPEQLALRMADVRESLLDSLERFLSRHGGGDDLGLRLRGEQLAGGIRFLRLLREGTYHLVVGNPPYQGTNRMVDPRYIKKQYSRGKADLYAVFLERGLQLTCGGGCSGLLTMRSWMFISQFSMLREHLLFKDADLRLLCDLDRGAFEDILDEVVATVMSLFRKTVPLAIESVAIQPTPLYDKARDTNRTGRKRAAVLAQDGRHTFKIDPLRNIQKTPVVYWWSEGDLVSYGNMPKLGEVSPARKGLCTGNDVRFIRKWWELRFGDLLKVRTSEPIPDVSARWTPSINGGRGLQWFEPLREAIRWAPGGLELETFSSVSKGVAVRNTAYYLREGVAFSMIGKECLARAHRFRSIFLDKGSSVFPRDIPSTLALINSTRARQILEALNPSMSYQVGDVNRLPVYSVDDADKIFERLEQAFAEHETHREASVEFSLPGSSAWRYAQRWAQSNVDRISGTPLSPYEPIYKPASPTALMSFAVGIAVGRFSTTGEGVLEHLTSEASPYPFLLLSSSHAEDDLSQLACGMLHEAWTEYGPEIAPKSDLRTWLQQKFFPDVHRKMYENRPIYFPLSSENRNFVAFVSIHRWTDDTLKALLAERLYPALTELEGEINDLLDARQQGDAKSRSQAEERYGDALSLRDELRAFVDLVRQCAEQGPPPADPSDTPREVNAPYSMDLDDGVMVNSAALWPLLEPQWKDPRKWWSELCNAKGKKDYDWSHLAARYFPSRVDAKCRKDPSLAVAHGCFWKYHPAKAYEWELRLQDEIGPDFTLDEEGSDVYRAAFEEEHPDEVEAIRAAEEKRRERQRKKEEKARKEAESSPTVSGPLFEKA